MSREKLGEFIRDAREVRDLTQEMLAEQIGYSRDTVSRWEKGETAITVEALIKILKVTRMQVTIGDEEAKVCIKIL